MASTITEEITKQIESYQNLKSTVTKLENILLYQRKTQNNNTIPRKYQPTQYLQVFGENEKNIQSRFDNDFKISFFKYLDEVITTNTIALEIQTCRLKCIISTTDSLLF